MAYDKVMCVFSIRDAKKQATRKEFELVTVDAATAETDAAALYALYTPLCDGDIVSYSVNGIKAVTESAEASSLKTDVMSVTMDLQGRPDQANMRLPCFPDDLSDANGVLILTDASVIAFQNAFVQLTPAIAKVSDGEYIEGFARGKLK